MDYIKLTDLKPGQGIVTPARDDYEFHSVVDAVGPDWLITRQMSPHYFHCPEGTIFAERRKIFYREGDELKFRYDI